MSAKHIDWYKPHLGTAPGLAAPSPMDSPLTTLPPLPQAISQGRAARPLRPGLFSIAPMIDKTSRHFRWFLRQMTKRAVLYTEMVTAPAIIHGRRDILLDFDPVEHPLVLQVGGDDPEQIFKAVTIARDWGYDEFNLNVGCPSDKVQVGRFGACLMADPGRVAEIVAAMARASDKPVTVKHRLGIEGYGYNRQSFEEMVEFISVVAGAGCERFIVHARIAMLEGLSPKENRSIPPIRYDPVYQLKKLYPNLRIELNGQIKTLADCAGHLSQGVDGLMIGRASYEHPVLMAELDGFEESWLAGKTGGMVENAAPRFDRRALVLVWADYMDQWKAKGMNPRSLVWPILELFPGVPGSRKYKQLLSQPYIKDVSVAGLAREALSHIPPDVL